MILYLEGALTLARSKENTGGWSKSGKRCLSDTVYWLSMMSFYDDASYFASDLFILD